jgi:hypothetical protein
VRLVRIRLTAPNSYFIHILFRESGKSIKETPVQKRCETTFEGWILNACRGGATSARGENFKNLVWDPTGGTVRAKSVGADSAHLAKLVPVLFAHYSLESFSDISACLVSKWLRRWFSASESRFVRRMRPPFLLRRSMTRSDASVRIIMNSAA